MGSVGHCNMKIIFWNSPFFFRRVGSGMGYFGILLLLWGEG